MVKQLKNIRMLILVFLTHKIALPLLKIFRRPNAFQYSVDELRNFSEGTLGNDLYLFLKQRNLPLLKYYVRHDLKHVLLGYDTTEEGEACLQSFMLGNGRVSFPVLATVAYSFVTMPEFHAKMKEAYKMGKRCISIHSWEWNTVIHRPTEDLRKKLFHTQTKSNH